MSALTFTASQEAAIDDVDSTLQLIACAGSGKTQVLAQRIARILAQPGVRPGNVIAFTFTEKAAAELKERVHSVVRSEIGEATGLAEMFIGTMHGYCLDLLQTYVPETFKYGVLTDITQQLLIDRESRRSGLTTCTKMVQGVETPLKRYLDTRTYRTALSVLQEDDVDFSRVRDVVIESLGSYRELLDYRKYFDYTSMMVDAVEFLKRVQQQDDLTSSERVLRDHVRDEVRYVIVDEYQDVNPIQERLVERLVHYGANLCVVGDDDQTIYQWRGSEVSNIITFANRYADVRTIELAENFRSSKGVVELGRTVAQRLNSSERLSKKMLYASHQEWHRGDLLALQFGDVHEEAEWIAQRILDLQGMPFVDKPGAAPRGLSWSDCAVLFRSVKDADAVVDELKRRKIPFIIKGLARLFDAAEIQACVGLFEYMMGEISASDLRARWDLAALIPDASRWAKLIAVLDDGADFGKSDRWGTYNIQRLYLKALEALGLREETVPGDARRRELVMYQLGKFSQAISDFEAIHFSSAPDRKYEAFVKFLQFQAPGVYEESDEDAGYVQPDAVVISTVHRAKGLQWPAVFIPFLRQGRFPMRGMGGVQVIPHIIAEDAVANGARYKGGISDETRLFYVAVTRAQKYLYVSYAPGEKRGQGKASEFYLHCTASSWMSTSDEGLPDAERLEPTPKLETPNIAISFSELKYLFDCPYQFKLRFMYGFNPPIHEALGYGKGLHDALAEMHKRALAGDVPSSDEAEALVDRHLHTPYAYPALREQLHRAAVEAIDRYFDRHGGDLTLTIHSEKQISVDIAPGVSVSGRIDLIKSLETDETAIVDFKSTARSQDEDVTRDQLAIYALGYEELSGASADRIQILNLDDQGKSTNDPVDPSLIAGIKQKVASVADDIRANHFVCMHDHSADGAFDDLVGLMPTGAGAGKS
ncbi:ATP-dependent helicase [Microbacterium bovistercoris]|uniref:DNA 3'-5' helicase n=1 Tax=Microbacterium bovistercoris TaxID=2293570 RepID=A0A371NYJ4_9MICO|nr:ATP-dependent DNA helicase [Microbacterium bovistercoris]REJ08750.1 ATP-dependent helicase [Microbacterium bovistercoris]